MSPPQQLRQRTSNCSSLLIYQPRNDETLNWPSWLTYSGWFTHVSGRPSAARRTAKARRPKTDVIPLDHATNWFSAVLCIVQFQWIVCQSAKLSSHLLLWPCPFFLSCFPIVINCKIQQIALSLVQSVPLCYFMTLICSTVKMAYKKADIHLAKHEVFSEYKNSGTVTLCVRFMYPFGIFLCFFAVLLH